MSELNEGNAPKAPLDVVREGGVFAKLWEKQNEQGRFVSIEIGRAYLDTQGEFQKSSSFTRTGLMKLEAVIRRANERAREIEGRFRKEDRAQENGAQTPRQIQQGQPAQTDMQNYVDQALANAAPEPSEAAPPARHRGPDQ